MMKGTQITKIGLPPMTERLNRKKAQLTAELQAVNEALGILKEHPDLEKLLNALNRVESMRY